jgi:hypothetical protein
MHFVSVTRLRLRSKRVGGCNRQALRTPGCQGLRTRKTRGLAFWTLTMWNDEKSMRSFVGIPKLSSWCDEASVAHWTQESGSMPEWEAATRVLSGSGRLLRVARPSEAHKKGQINFD